MNTTHDDCVSSMMKAKRFVVKVGTSSLTDENSRLDVGKVANLVSMIMREKKKGRDPVLISSGAIGAGLGRLGLPGRPGEIQALQAAAAVGQGILMQTYEFFFNSYEQPIAQLLLTREDFTDATRYRNLSNTLETLISWGVIPIINENDTIATEEIKVGDNDTLASYVTMGVKAELLVILSDVDGLYTAKPLRFGGHVHQGRGEGDTGSRGLGEQRWERLRWYAHQGSGSKEAVKEEHSHRHSQPQHTRRPSPGLHGGNRHSVPAHRR